MVKAGWVGGPFMVLVRRNASLCCRTTLAGTVAALAFVALAGGLVDYWRPLMRALSWGFWSNALAVAAFAAVNHCVVCIGIKGQGQRVAARVTRWVFAAAAFHGFCALVLLLALCRVVGAGQGWDALTATQGLAMIVLFVLSAIGTVLAVLGAMNKNLS